MAANEAMAILDNLFIDTATTEIYTTTQRTGSNHPRLQIWKRHWFVLVGLKLRVYDFEYREDRRLVGEMDLAKLVGVRVAERDRVDVENALQLDISGIGRLFLFADSAESAAKWSEKLGYVLEVVKARGRKQ